MAEQIADIGYVAVKKETTKGVPVTPNIYLPVFQETLSINQNIESIDPIVGGKFMRYNSMRGSRAFQGDITFLGEPNVAGYVFDMLLNKVSTSGGGPYTHTFALNNTNPNSYSVDIAKGRSVHRFFGLESREVSPEFDDNRMKLKSTVTALGAFTGAIITNVSTNVLTLSSEYDPIPTRGLVASDLVRIFLANGSVVDTTISSLTNTTVTVASAGAVATNDFLTLRPATPTYSLVDYFQWDKSEFRFGTSASVALSATHTPVEPDSAWSIIHEMLPDNGANRSGAYDPVSIIRGRGDATLKTKIFFDTPDEQSRFREQSKRAVVVRHFANVANIYELRVTFNNLVINEIPVNLEVGNVLFNDIDWLARYDTTDAQMFNVVVINNVASI